MNLSLADKLALIYTSAGSQRNVAALVGVSHQKIGRILRTGQDGGYAPQSRALTDPGLIAAVNQAFAIHTDVAKSQARADGLPFSSEIPIFYQRLPLMNGAPGDRVGAMHTHWLPDRIRNAWIGRIQQSGKFYGASIQSIVNLQIYNNRGDKANQGRARTPLQKIYRKEFKAMLQAGIKRGSVNTPYTPLDKSFPLSDVIADITRKIREKHEPAADDKSRIGSQYLLQLDTRRSKQNAATKTQTRGNKRRAGKPKT